MGPPDDGLMAERSVTRAAERLTVGQSAMSATLAACGACSTIRCWCDRAGYW